MPSPKFQVKLVAPVLVFIKFTECETQPNNSVAVTETPGIITLGATRIFMICESLPQALIATSLSSKVSTIPV